MVESGVRCLALSWKQVWENEPWWAHVVDGGKQEIRKDLNHGAWGQHQGPGSLAGERGRQERRTTVTEPRLPLTTGCVDLIPRSFRGGWPPPPFPESHQVKRRLISIASGPVLAVRHWLQRRNLQSERILTGLYRNPDYATHLARSLIRNIQILICSLINKR